MYTTSMLINLFKDVFMIISILIIMLRLDYRLALVSYALLPRFHRHDAVQEVRNGRLRKLERRLLR